MDLISFESKGSFRQTERFLANVSKGEMYAKLSYYGDRGVEALASATPKESGLTAESWSYRIGHKRGTYSITWHNSHVEGNSVIAILLQYGHGTGTGGYVQGKDYINPAIKPIFDQIADEVWKAVKSS